MVHYDIMRPFAKRFEHYANDPAIKELTTSGAALTVLILAPNREVLLEQAAVQLNSFIPANESSRRWCDSSDVCCRPRFMTCTEIRHNCGQGHVVRR